jgi:DNA-binding transcriptional MerR regulator
MAYGSDEKGGFNPSSKAYKANPTIEKYLELRHADPDAEIEIATVGGFDPVLAMRAELETQGFTIDEMMKLLDANQETISDVSLRLLEELSRQKSLAESGETQLVRREKAMPLKLIDWVIAISLEALSWTDSMEMNRDLIVLINARLIGENPHYKSQVQASEQRQRAVWIGAQLVARGQKISIRKVAEALGVAPSTVSRWFEPGEFETKCEEHSSLFREDGSFRSLNED